MIERMVNLWLTQFCGAIICVLLSFIHFNAAERYNVHKNLLNVTHFHKNIESGAFLPEEEPPNGIIFVFGTFAIATLIKYVSVWLKIKFPATILIFAIGGFIGGMSYLSVEVHEYVKGVCDMSPKYIFTIFLPVLVFRPSYSIDSQLFKKSSKPIVLFSTIGFLISTCIMSLMMKCLFFSKWHIEEAILFGIISSTCYSEYTVNMLQDIGQSKYIRIIMEGESLLTDASAIVLFNIVIGYSIGYIPGALSIFVICLLFLIASPLVGFIVGKITVCVLRVMSQDPIGSATVTLVVTYLSFYISENLMRCSGVLCVVVLGIVISVERMNIHSDLDTFLQQFWDLLYFYANSLIFMMVGVLIFEIIVDDMEFFDGMMSLVVYVMSFICRGVMYSIMNVGIKWCKCELPWEHVAVCVWGNLRGPVSLCLALVIEKAEGIGDKGSTYLTYATVLVLLTHIVQGSSLYFVMKILGLTEITEARLANMSSVMKYFHITRERSINMIKMDRHLSDVNWLIVEEGTQIIHPYEVDLEKLDEGFDLFLGIRMAFCPDCEKEILTDPTITEYQEMQKEAYLRILKARKVSYRNQYEHGVLSKTAVHLLITAVDIAVHRTVPIMELRDLRTHWTRRKIAECIRKFIVKLLWRHDTIPPSRHMWRINCYRIVTSRSFDYSMCVIYLIHIILTIVEIQYVLVYPRAEFFTPIVIVNILLGIIFTIEFFLKITTFGYKKYFRDVYNSFDFLILLATFVNINLYIRYWYMFYRLQELNEKIVLSVQLAIELLRVVRLIRLFRVFLPYSLDLVDTIMEYHVTLNFEIDRGFIAGEEEILKILPHIIDNKKICVEIKQGLEVDRLAVARKSGYTEKEFPEITISVKTRQAIRIVLNKIKEAVNELKNRGILDDFEYLNCKQMIDKRVKQLQSHYRKIEACPPHILMKEVPWIGRHSAVASFLLERAQPVTFNRDEIIISQGSDPESLYIILYGLIKLVYEPSQETTMNLKVYGALPNVDYFTTLHFEERLEEYIVGGNVIGELGILNGRPYDATAKCETSVQAFRLTSNDLEYAITLQSDLNVGLRAQMWKSVALRVANVILTNTSHYQGWTPEDIKYHLERAYVPNLSQDTTFTVSDFIEDVLLIEGQVMDVYSRNIYYAPCCLPRTTQKLYFPDCENVKISTDIETKLLIVPMKHVYDIGMQENGANMKLSQSFSVRCLQHSILHASSRNLMSNVKRHRTRKKSRDTPSSKSQVLTPKRDIESGKEPHVLRPTESKSMLSVEEEIDNQLLSNGGERKPIAFVAKKEGRKRKSSVGDVRSSLSPNISILNPSSDSASNKDEVSQQHTASENAHPQPQEVTGSEEKPSEVSKNKEEEKRKDKEKE